MAKQYDNRFTGIMYVNGSTSVGGFIHDGDMNNLKLSGKRADGVAELKVYRDGEQVGSGSIRKRTSSTGNPDAPLVQGEITIDGVRTKLAGWRREINGTPAIQLAPDKMAEAVDPADVF